MFVRDESESDSAEVGASPDRGVVVLLELAATWSSCSELEMAADELDVNASRSCCLSSLWRWYSSTGDIES